MKEQLAEWLKQLDLQKARQNKVQEVIRQAKIELTETEQQILLLTGGITFAKSLESQDTAPSDTEEQEQCPIPES